MNLYQYVNFNVWNNIKSGAQEIGGRIKNVGQGLRDTTKAAVNNWLDKDRQINREQMQKDTSDFHVKTGTMMADNARDNLEKDYHLDPDWTYGVGNNSRDVDMWNTVANNARKNKVIADNNIQTIKDFNKKTFLPNVKASFGNIMRPANAPNTIQTSPTLTERYPEYLDELGGDFNYMLR